MSGTLVPGSGRLAGSGMCGDRRLPAQEQGAGPGGPGDTGEERITFLFFPPLALECIVKLLNFTILSYCD